jgi:pSer/pThr/pTyr-binding forkhead associated (FHA) protein
MLLQIFIKDVKGSNGTFVNDERLRPECFESEPYKLKWDNIVVRSPFSVLVHFQLSLFPRIWNSYRRRGQQDHRSS